MHVIVGAGTIGSRVALLLADRGEPVRIVSRRGGGPDRPGIERVAADAAAGLTDLTRGATVIYNCANPAYHRWLTDWPPLADAMLHAAKANDAVLAITGNLYGYGPVTGPIRHDTPLAATHPKLRLRAQMWEDAVASGARVTEVRASDYLGYQVNGVLEEMVLKFTAKGKTAHAFGDPDAPHSWTDVDDVARTLVTVATDERAWGSAWLAPTDVPMSMRTAAARANELIGAPPAKVRRLPYGVLWTAGLVSPMMRELRTTYYQFAAPFVLDSSQTERTFGLKPTPIDTSLAATARAHRDR